ncbi:MAG: helix-turn-helix transcriptional regulator [Candidatus Moranbacteria bacterium]|nr:helix-turn-helix transcriptional regulator [Candidatus Moranbacteria bacterium]
MDEIKKYSSMPREAIELLESQLLALSIQEFRESGEIEIPLEKPLRERIKELQCLFGLVQLIDEHENSIEEILQGVVDLLPNAWQYPESCCARVLYKGNSYQTMNFQPTPWSQGADLNVLGRNEGRVEVFYLQKMATSDEGPFLKEERLLINAVGLKIAKAIERIEILLQLKVERQALQDANVALYDSLVQSQKGRKNLGRSIQAKINKIILPIFSYLESDMNVTKLKYLDLIKRNLSDIVSPFIEGNPNALNILSPTELVICNMIKNGFSSKEISKLRNISPATVNRQRESIRRKLRLTNSKINLVSYLNGLEERK